MADSRRELREGREEDVGRALFQEHLDDVVDLPQRLDHLVHLHVLRPRLQLVGRKDQGVYRARQNIEI